LSLLKVQRLYKTGLLKVPKYLIEGFTPESMEVTESIARGLSSVIPADIHIGITGLPCPGGIKRNTLLYYSIPV
jgi:nicotinamide mononucleotide (NMN) deamidase PncC